MTIYWCKKIPSYKETNYNIHKCNNEDEKYKPIHKIKVVS